MTRLILALLIAVAMTSCVATPSQTTTTTTTRQSTTGPAANAQSTAERIDTSGW